MNEVFFREDLVKMGPFSSYCGRIGRVPAGLEPGFVGAGSRPDFRPKGVLVFFHLFADSCEIFRKKSKNLLAIILLIAEISSNRWLRKKLVRFFDAVKSWLFGCFLWVFCAVISI